MELLSKTLPEHDTQSKWGKGEYLPGGGSRAAQDRQVGTMGNNGNETNTNNPGTMSTRAALRILLQGDIYHMMCVGKERPDHHPLWRQALNKTITKYVRKSVFDINNIVIYLEMDGRH